MTDTQYENFFRLLSEIVHEEGKTEEQKRDTLMDHMLDHDQPDEDLINLTTLTQWFLEPALEKTLATMRAQETAYGCHHCAHPRQVHAPQGCMVQIAGAYCKCTNQYDNRHEYNRALAKQLSDLTI